MVKVSIICLIVVFALLLEDGSSVKKKTEDEKKEDKEIQKAVNATLAEEERKRKEEEDEAKKKKNVAVKQESGEKDVGRQDEACPPVNFSCPVVWSTTLWRPHQRCASALRLVWPASLCQRLWLLGP